MKFTLTAHALDRYIERVKPILDRDGARRELGRLLEVAPEPVPSLDYLEPGDFEAFVEVAPGIALGLKHANGAMRAVSCLTRTCTYESERARRRDEKRKRKRKRQAQKRRERLARRNGESRPTTYGPGWPD